MKQQNSVAVLKKQKNKTWLSSSAFSSPYKDCSKDSKTTQERGQVLHHKPQLLKAIWIREVKAKSGLDLSSLFSAAERLKKLAFSRLQRAFRT